MYELALFAGAGGGILGGILCGHQCIGAVEIEEYPRKVLLARQRDGVLPEFPIWDDVRTFRRDNPETGEYIEFLRSIRSELVISGGFPCTDISLAGKGAGLDGEHSSLWWEFARIIGEVEPRYAFVENSPALTIRGGLRVVGSLAELGYDCKWGIVGADDAGAPHRRKRIWILAESQHWSGRNVGAAERGEGSSGERAADTDSACGSSEQQAVVADANKYPNPEPGKDRSSKAGGEKLPIQKIECERNGKLFSELGNSLPGRITWWDTDPADLPNADSERESQPEGSEQEERGRAGDGNREERLSREEERHHEKILEILSDTDSLDDDRRGHGTSSIRGEQSGQADVSGSETANIRDADSGTDTFGEIRRGQNADACGSCESGSEEDRPTKPRLGRVAYGVANRIHRLKTIGNGQVPAVVALAWHLLKGDDR